MQAVYLIKNNKSEKIYIGTTSNIRRRFRDHNLGHQKATQSKEKGSWKLIYLEIFSSRKDAFNRERKLKHHGSAKKELLKRIENSLKTKSEAGHSKRLRATVYQKHRFLLTRKGMYRN